MICCWPVAGSTFRTARLIFRTLEILITLLDENKILGLTDTSVLKVAVEHPDGAVEEFPFDGEILNPIIEAPLPINNFLGSMMPNGFQRVTLMREKLWFLIMAKIGQEETTLP